MVFKVLFSKFYFNIDVVYKKYLHEENVCMNQFRVVQGIFLPNFQHLQEALLCHQRL